MDPEHGEPERATPPGGMRPLHWVVIASAVTALTVVVGMSVAARIMGDDEDCCAPPPSTSITSTTTTTTTTTTSTTTTTTALPIVEVYPEPEFDPSWAEPVGTEIPWHRLLDNSLNDTSAPNGPITPDGSGCSPGSDELPDGTWYGELIAVRESTIEFDLACRYSGSAARRQADLEGFEWLNSDDFHVTNTSHTIRSARLSDDAVIIDTSRQGPGMARQSRTELTDRMAPLATEEWLYPQVWIVIDQGRVTWLEFSIRNYAG